MRVNKKILSLIIAVIAIFTCLGISMVAYSAESNPIVIDCSAITTEPVGCVFELKNENGDSLGEFTADENGYVDLGNIPAGKYTLTSLSAQSGYSLNGESAYEFEVEATVESIVVPNISHKILNNGQKVDTKVVASGETYTYELTTQLPDTSKCLNYNDKDWYEFFIEDIITSNIRPDVSSFEVKIGDDVLVPNRDYTIGFIALPGASDDDLMIAGDFMLYNELVEANTSDLFVLGWINFNDYCKGINFCDLAKNYEVGTPITVTYNATLTDNAVSALGNSNYAAVEYTDIYSDTCRSLTPVDEVTTYTTGVEITAYGTDEQSISGSKFSFEAADTNNEIKNVKISGDATAVYNTTNNKWMITFGDSGILSIKGLNQGTYYLTEISAPNGYQTANSVILITISAMTPSEVVYNNEVSAAFQNSVYSDGAFIVNVQGVHDAILKFDCVMDYASNENTVSDVSVLRSATIANEDITIDDTETTDVEVHKEIEQKLVDGNNKTVFVKYANDEKFYDANDNVINGWKNVTSVTNYYHSGSNYSGSCYAGKYYFKNGIMQFGWQTIDDSKYYFNSDGVAVTDYKNINGKYYYFEPDGKFYTGWQKLNNKWYYFESNGNKVTGFKVINNKKYYFNNDGSMVTGSKVIGGDYYYFDSNGAMKTGWVKFDDTGKWKYYEGKNDNYDITSPWYGIAVKDTYHFINNTKYFFDKYANMRTGWIKDEYGSTKGWYYFNSDGTQKKGWNYIDGYWYYFRNTGKNYMASSGFQSVDGKRYYFNSNAQMQTGWIKLGGEWYYAATSGEFLSGWQKINNKWYYFYPTTEQMTTGFMITGSKNEKLYYFGTDGAMRENEWVWFNTGWIYFGSDGNQCTSGWKKLDSKWYYFKAGQFHYAAANEFIYDNGKEYYLKSDCSMATGTFKVNGLYCVANSDGSLTYNGWKKISGNWYYFKNGRSITGWISENGKKYYCRNSDGMMYANTTIYINGKACVFNASGEFTGYGSNGGGTSTATTK